MLPKHMADDNLVQHTTLGNGDICPDLHIPILLSLGRLPLLSPNSGPKRGMMIKPGYLN